MKKMLAALTAGTLGLLVVQKMRAQRNERDLWAEATDDVTD